MTQYLTVVQGMPKAVEENLIRQTCTFTWDNEGKPTIGLGTLTASIPDRGKQLLDIGMRNVAIEMMWIKGYLKMSDNCPSWADFADRIFAKYATNEQLIVPPAARINHWLQTWHPVQKRLPGPLQHMTRTAKAANLRMDALIIDSEVQRNIPIWFHHAAMEELRSYNNHPHSKCLWGNHNVTTVGQLEKTIQGTDPNHQQKRGCICHDCAKDKNERGCQNPVNCRRTAKKIMNCLPPKWNTWNTPPEMSAPELTREQKKANEDAYKHDKTLIFDLTMRLTNLYQGYRILLDREEPCHEPAKQQTRWTSTQNNGLAPIQVTTSGAIKTDSEEDKILSRGAYYGPNDPKNASLRVDQERETTAEGEMLAILQVLKQVLKNRPLHLKIESKETIWNLTIDLPRQESSGWLGSQCKKTIQAIIAELRE